MKEKKTYLIIDSMISLIAGSKDLSRGDTLRHLEVKYHNYGWLKEEKAKNWLKKITNNFYLYFFLNFTIHLSDVSQPTNRIIRN